MSTIKPFLKWAGGKFRLLERILPELAGAGRYVEPFAGSAAVYLNTAAPEAVVNDVNADLIALYSHIQAEGEAFMAYAATFFTPKTNTEAAFYELRARFNAATAPRERAALLLYLNKHAYNGLIRYNARGGYNVPFGRYKAPQFPRDDMRRFWERTRQGHTVFTCRDFREVFAGVRAGDVVYCDPPYAPLSATANFTSYAGNVFGPKDQEELASLARRAYSQGATVVLSNHDTPQIRALYAGADILAFDVQRFISCKGQARGRAPELLAVYRAV
ncbi:MAG TPA: Dam family site-specific DNA-(adenine-N6)-methyltransferase [Candidatus Avidesulfovibrio excrementigallinarum]|nr:Dam family site-specific DNA-(adenine-N6)-methyltransferase [Candidatus Avidesulfovibrio excrementigallinarum]